MMKLRRLWRVPRRGGARLAGMSLALALALCGCQTMIEPVTGRHQFILTTPAAESQMSLEAWGDLLKNEKPATDRAKIAAVERVGSAIQAVVRDQPGFTWEFRTFASEEANAFCLPGGKVGVYEGIFKYVANDAELATVVAHEIGHAIARHGGERMTQAMLVNLGAAGLAAALGGQAAADQERWLAAYAGISTVGLVLPYSRTHEYSADEIGIVMMAKAGYDPQAAIDFWTKFAEGKSGGGIAEFLSTHPVGANRVAKLKQNLPKARREYELAPTRRGLGKIYAAAR